VEAAVRNERGEWAIPRDVSAKPPWFTALNPEGKVPTLLYKEDAITHVIPESLVCLEFLEDFAPAGAPSLLPPHPATRAAARLAARRIDDAFVPPFYRLLTGGQAPEVERADKAALLAAVDWLEEVRVLCVLRVCVSWTAAAAVAVALSCPCSPFHHHLNKTKTLTARRPGRPLLLRRQLLHRGRGGHPLLPAPV
jgi:hypothetical protein